MRKLTMDFFGDTAKRLSKVRRKFGDQAFSFNLRCCHGQLASLPVASSRPLISLTAKCAKLQATTPLPMETRKVARGNTLILGPKNGHQSPILSNGFHPTKQHSICCRSENCISLAISGQSAVDSIDSFHLSNGKVYYRFDKCGRRSDNRISLVTTATWCKIVESIDSFDWWEWLFHSRFHIKSLSNRRVHVNED